MVPDARLDPPFAAGRHAGARLQPELRGVRRLIVDEVSAALVCRPLGADAADLARLGDCIAHNSERRRSAAALEWLYADNPSGGRRFVDVALDGERVVAIYAGLPQRLRVGERSVLALQSLDTLTDAAYRGRGLFPALARSLYARAEAQGVGLVYGFPNARSAPGFFSKLGWTRLDPVPFLIRPLSLRYAAGRVRALARVARWLPDVPLALPRVPRALRRRLVELDGFDERVSELWRRFREGGAVELAVERDAEYFAWRVAHKPDAGYRTLAFERRDGTLDALCTFAVQDKHGGRIGYVLELLHAPGARLAASLLLARVVAEAARQGADAMLAWCFAHAPNFPSFCLNGFVPLPERWRPIELHFGVRAFEPELAPRVTERRSWYLSYLDSDTV